MRRSAGREVELEGERENREADDDTDGDSAGVDRVVAHTLEDDTRTADGVHDCRQTVLSQDVDGSTGGVVGTVTNHGAEVTETLERLDDLVLVLGEDSGETDHIEDHPD